VTKPRSRSRTGRTVSKPRASRARTTSDGAKKTGSKSSSDKKNDGSLKGFIRSLIKVTGHFVTRWCSG